MAEVREVAKPKAKFPWWVTGGYIGSVFVCVGTQLYAPPGAGEEIIALQRACGFVVFAINNVSFMLAVAKNVLDTITEKII